MIKNQKQAGVTREKLADFKKAKKEFEKNKAIYSQEEFDLGINSFDNLIGDLEQQLQVYKSLVKGNFHCLHPKSLSEIPNILIAARLAQNMSHEELGKLIGVKHQQIQRYEATDYETASWLRIVEIAIALKLEFYLKAWIKERNKNELLFTCPKGMTKDQADNAEQKVKSLGLFSLSS